MEDNKYFTHKELSCKSTGVVKLASGFLDDLIALRKEYDRPMSVSSCCRSYEHNRSIGGHPRSMHVYDKPHHQVDGTCAIDITTVDSRNRADLVRIALSRGWSVGVAKKFIHLDRRNYAGLPQVLYVY